MSVDPWEGAPWEGTAQEGASWEQELSPVTSAYLADLMDIGSGAPATGRPAMLTITPRQAAAPQTASAAERLADAVQGISGLVQVSVRERPFPLWLRAGTADLAAALKALAQPQGGFAIPYRPRRILEIGAGAGYRSIALAAAWPEAEILTAESDLTLQRVALLNTLPYRNITCAFTTLSTDNARYSFAGRSGAAGHAALARDDAGTITAQPLKNFLYARGWSVFDTLIISPDAASDHLLRTPFPASVRLIAVETGGAPLADATAERFPEDRFLVVEEGDYVLLFRRDFDAQAVPVGPVPVFDPEGRPQSLALAHVATNPPGFFPLGNHGFRLHPNAPDSPAARLMLSQACRNYRKIQLILRSALPVARPIRFTLRIIASPGGEALATAAEILAPGETRNLTVPLAPHDGACEVIFTTEMAEFSDSNAGAWAEILAANFV